MKKTLLLFILLMVTAGTSAQGKKGKFNPQKFQADMEAYIVKEADLSQQETAKFLPVYREMSKKQHALYSEQKQYRRLKDVDENTYLKAVKATDEIEVKLKKPQQQYHQKFLNILPASKVYKIIRLEQRFHRQEFSKKISREHPNR